MKISKTSITCLAREGRMTLQIPQYYIGETPDDLIDAPDEWFTELKPICKPCVGAQSGYTYLSRTGWEANSEQILIAYETACGMGGLPRQAFEKYVEDHFELVEKELAKAIKAQEKKLEQLKNTIV